MNKHGFTLIEISISVALLSVVLLFVINILTIIRNNEDDIALDTQLELNKSLISKTVNSDILENGGIKTITCDDELSCNITLNTDDAKRNIYITNENKEGKIFSVIHYIDTTDTSENKILFTRKSFEGYDYRFSLREETLVTILTLEVIDHPSYNVQIVSKN